MRGAGSLPLASLFLLACQGPREWAEAAGGGSGGGADGGRDMSAVRGDMANGGAPSDVGASIDASSAAEAAPPLPPPAANLRRLTVMVTGPGEILVDEQPLPCPVTCVVDRAPGTPVTVATRPGKTATGPISMFIGWSGACTGKGGCVVTLDEHKTVTANFHRFVGWEETIVSSAKPTPRLSFNPVGRDLYVSGEFWGTLGVGGRSVTSSGFDDGIVMRYADDGRPLWTRTISGPTGTLAGLVVPGLTPPELRLAVSVGSAGASYGMQALPGGGSLHLFLNPDGELLRFIPTQAQHPYSAIQGPFQPSPFPKRFAYIDFDGAQGTTRLQLIDENGRVSWSKPDVSGGHWADAQVCDSSGSVVALHGLTSTVTIAGATFDPAAGDALLVKVSFQGEYVWAAQFTHDGATTLDGPSVFCDQAGDVYVVASFKGELKFGDRSARTLEGPDTNIAVIKVLGATPQLRWLSTFGGKYEDNVKAWAVEAGGKLLIAPTFVGDVTIAGETFPEGQVVIPIDPATGSAVSAFPVGRSIVEMATHPTAGAYFIGKDGFGQVIPPP